MTGRCQLCGHKYWPDGKEREINYCSVCGQVMCIACWRRHSHPGQSHYYTERKQ